MRRLIFVLALLSTALLVGLGQAQADILPPDPLPACGDGLDNDGNRLIDYPDDPGCFSDMDYKEAGAPPPPDEWFEEGEIPGDGDGDPSDEVGSTCRQKELKRSMSERGPWGRRLFLLTTWCYDGGKITRSRSTVRTSHDLFCSNTHDPRVEWTGAGGAGFAFVEIQAWVEVECASIPASWPKYHDTLLMRVRYFADGHYQRVAYD